MPRYRRVKPLPQFGNRGINPLLQLVGRASREGRLGDAPLAGSFPQPSDFIHHP
jgi:hypothetical protein